MSWIESSEVPSKYGLDVDQSFYNVTSKFGVPLYLYTLSADCVKCPFTKLRKVTRNSSFVINTASEYSFRVFEDDQGTYSNASTYLCEVNRTRAEFGAYQMIIHANGSCDVETIVEPVNIYFRKHPTIRNFFEFNILFK